MKASNIFYLILLGIATACSGTEEEAPLLPPAPVASMQRLSFLNEAAIDYTVWAFYNNGEQYVFQQSFSAGAPYTTVSLPVGEYQFLFASGWGTNTLLQPQPGVNNRPLFGQMQFTVQPDPLQSTYLSESDELFLQDKNADQIYDLNHADTIRCNLKRAVAQAIVRIQRGYETDAGTYAPLPYPSGDHLLRYFREIQIDLSGIGTSVNALGSTTGNSQLSVVRTANEGTITDKGFASFTGPFFLPAANNTPIDIKITLRPAANSPIPELSMQTTGQAERNQQMIITVWIAQDWNIVDLTVDLLPIQEAIDGEQDIWDDNVQP